MTPPIITKDGQSVVVKNTPIAQKESVADGTMCQDVSLPRFRQVLADCLDYTEKQAEAFDADTNAVIQKISEWLSGAGKFRKAFQSEMRQAREDLNSADKALNKGDLKQAYHLLQKLQDGLSKAGQQWRNYVNSTAGGADSAAGGLRIVRNTSVAFVGTGATLLTFGVGTVIAGSAATSVGMHIGLISVASEGQIGTPAPEDPQPKKDAPMPKPINSNQEPEWYPQTECLAADQRADESADYDGKGCVASSSDPAAQELETQIAAAIKEEEINPETVKKDEKALIDEASQALQNLNSNPAALGNFLLQIEAPEKINQDQLLHLSELQKQWEADISAYKAAAKTAGKGKEAEAIMKKLFDDYLTLYARGNANLSDMLDGRGGNCEAQTKLIIAAMTASGVELPKNQRLAVQIFEDHMQAVIYDKKTGIVHNLLTGEETTEIRAPLYEPHIFYYAYLASQGKKIPVSLQNLLIVDVEGEATSGGTSYATNSGLKFPIGKGVFNNDPIPEFAYVNRPSDKPNREETFGNGKMNKQVRPGRPQGQVISEEAASLETDRINKAIYKGETFENEEINRNLKDHFENCERHDSHQNRLFTKTGFDKVHNFVQGGELLVFQTKELADFYNSLSTPEAKIKFLITLTNQAIAVVLNSPDIKNGIAILSDPSSLKEQDSQKINTAIDAIHLVQNIIDHTVDIIMEIIPLPETKDLWLFYERREPTGKFVTNIIRQRNSLLRALETKRDGLRNRIEKNPLEFTLFMDQLSTQRSAFMDLVDCVDISCLPRFTKQSTATEELEKTIKDRSIIGIGEKLGYKTQITGEQFIYATLVGPDLGEIKGEAGSKNEPGQKGQKKEDNDFVNESPAPYRVKAESMIDFVLEYAPERWNPALAKEFQRLNQDGRYDDVFLSRYYRLNNTYPKSERTFDHPFLKDCPQNGVRMMRERDMKVSHDIYLILLDIKTRREKNNPADSPLKNCK